MPELNQQTMLYAPALTAIPRSGWTFFVDGEAPNWASVDERGAWLLRVMGEHPLPFSELVARYGGQFRLDSGKAWVHVHAFVSETLRHGILSLAPVEYPPYQGRSAHLRLSRLREAWLHTNNSCNLSCAHCLVSSSPKGEPGLPTATWRRLIEEVIALGVDRCYITGGEPFVRQDLPELIQLITETHGIELI
ncbi:MAG: 4Fe-4S cluster-binding domain-containing protein, partial [Candidatus Omnitrophica bacterium]|nr:4Fe-4S cluster-binding domain-containing protein [Candidatus Omnitrophota bacterium]